MRELKTLALAPGYTGSMTKASPREGSQRPRLRKWGVGSLCPSGDGNEGLLRGPESEHQVKKHVIPSALPPRDTR